jgi:DNA-binding transcriptional MerR regulator
VGELSARVGVSVRTLHHYDAIGLLSPSDRSGAGYRVYGPEEVERLHRILVYRELGFDLAGIARILDDPTADVEARLAEQRAMLEEEIGRLTRMKTGVERMMARKRTDLNLTEAEMKEVFGEFDPREHEAEVEERWGETDPYRESRRRVARYGKGQWEEIGREAEGILVGLVAAFKEGESPSSERAMDLVEAHRLHIGRWFYDCSHEIHLGLGEMYEADPRFRKHYDDRAPGLAVFVRDAIRANADRAEG